MSEFSDASLNLQNTQEMQDSFPSEFSHLSQNEPSLGVVSEVEESGLPGDIRSRLHNLSDFKITFALSDVASLLKYVIDEVHMLKVHNAKEYVYLQQQCKRNEDLSMNTAVEHDKQRDTVYQQGELLQKLQKRLDRQDQEVVELKKTVKDHEHRLYESNNQLSALHSQCEELRAASNEYGSQGNSNRMSLLMPMRNIGITNNDSSLFDNGNNLANLSRVSSSVAADDQHHIQSNTTESMTQHHTLKPPPLSITANTPTNSGEHSGIPIELKAVAEAVKVLAKHQQAFNKYICSHLHLQNLHAWEHSNLRPTSSAGSTCSSVRSYGLALTRQTSSQESCENPQCFASGCCLADHVVRALTLAPKLLGVDSKEAEKIRNSQLAKQQQEQEVLHRQNAMHASQPSVDGIPTMDPTRRPNSTILTTRERSLSTSFAVDEDDLDTKYLTTNEFERCKLDIMEKLGALDGQQERMEPMNVQLQTIFSSQEQLQEQLQQVQAWQEGEFGNADDMVFDANAIRRSIVSLHAKLRQLSDKVDTVSNLAISTRQTLSKPKEEDVHAVKAQSQRTYECEMGMQELQDKLTMLAHFCKQLKNGSMNTNHNISTMNTNNNSVSNLDDSITLVTRHAAIDTILDHQIKRKDSHAMSTQLAHALRDQEQLEGLQGKLDDAKTVLQRLDDVVQLDSKVQSLLETDMIERITYLERRVNTEQSFFKSHLSGKVDQANFRAVLSVLQSTTGNNNHNHNHNNNTSKKQVSSLSNTGSGMNSSTGGVILSHADLITAMSGKADTVMLRRLEELVRALDRQTREALVKVMKDVVTLQTHEKTTQRLITSSKSSRMSHNNHNSMFLANTDTNGINTTHLQQQVEELVRQIEQLRSVVGTQEVLLQQKANQRAVDTLREEMSLVEREPQAESTQSPVTSDEKLIRVYQQSESTVNKLHQHQEWIARNALDIRDQREWVRFAQGVLEQQGSTNNSIRLLDLKLDKLQKTQPILPTINRNKTSTPGQAAGTYRGLDKCIVCDKDTSTSQKVPEHTTLPLKRYVTSHVPAGGLNGTRSFSQLTQHLNNNTHNK